VANLTGVIAVAGTGYFVRRQPESALTGGARQAAPGRRGGDVELEDHPPAAGLAEPRQRLEGLRRRRQTVRLTCTGGYGAQRWPGTRTPAIGRGDRPPGRAWARTSPSRAGTRCAVADELTRRFRLPVWRFANSGTEATMDAVAPDARDHRPGPDHQGGGLLSRPPRLGSGLGSRPARRRPARRRSPSRAASSTGIPAAITSLTLIVPFNDLASVARVLTRTAAPWQA